VGWLKAVKRLLQSLRPWLYLALSDRLSVGPRWLLLGIILVLLVPIVFTYQRGHQNITRALTFIADGTLTIALIGSLVLLVRGVAAA
jgi:hypothetical protein